MGYAIGFKWNPARIFRLKELKLEGLKEKIIAEILTKEFSHKITVTMIDNVVRRYDVWNYIIPIDPEIKIYKGLRLPDDNYMISCDHHAPYYSEKWVNYKLAIAEKFKIKKDIEVGDLFDFDFVSKHPRLDGQRRPDIDYEVLKNDPLIKALNYFDDIYLLRGNHEWRVSRYTDSMLQA
ncbi:unnamed protein product, partial [marine sediment metagenome]